MNILARHIEVLLLEHDCVVVPNIGGFISNHESAKYIAEEHQFFPPYRSVAFNSQLSVNDGLLVQSYMQAYDAAYPEALRQLEKDIDKLILQLDTTGEYQLGSLGTLHKDLENKISLESSASGLLTPDYYGLYSFECKSVAELQKERETRIALEQTNLMPVQTENDVLGNNIPEKKEEKQKANVHSHRHRFLHNLADFSIAAAIAAVMFFTFSYVSLRNTEFDNDVCVATPLPLTINHAERAPKQNVKETAVEKKAEENTPEVKTETGTEKETIQTDNISKSFSIVLASYVTETNANLYIEKLDKQGFHEARFVAKGKMTRIVYGSYATQEEATDSLRSLREKDPAFEEAWVLKL